MHYFEYIAGLKIQLEKLKRQNKLGGREKHWSVWLARPYYTQTFDMALRETPKDFDGLAFRSDVESNLAHLGRLKLWVYGEGLIRQIQVLQNAYQKASVLCARAGHALLTQSGEEQVQKVVRQYFSDESFDYDSDVGKYIAPQYISVMQALGTKWVFFVPGDSDRSGRDALAYVDPLEDNRKLDAKMLKASFNVPWGMIKINSGFFDGKDVSGGDKDRQADRNLKHGATLLHELTHLFAEERTEDVGVNRIKSVNKTKYSVRSDLKACFGRTACKALGASMPRLNSQNADTLAYLAVDLFLAQTGTLSLEKVIGLN